tara:strand:+ start:46 stop:540 length:495 start_codon:yes stop_codon:yes gene_type:complete
MNYSLGRITTQYIDNEDRLRVLGESSEGIICEIWLTRRLMDRLIENLLSNIQSEGSVDKALQVFEQEVASSSLLKQSPVEQDDQIISWLAIAIDVNRDNKNISLTFKEEKSNSASISFQTIELRQWFSIIYNAYKLAGWSLEEWPEWFKKSKDETVSGDTYSVH